MRVIFLDFDGVLATQASYNRWRRRMWLTTHDYLPRTRRGRDDFRAMLPGNAADAAELLDPDNCARVQRLCDIADASIVISSSWRKDHHLDVLRAMLADRGITAPVLRATPVVGHRGAEIAAVVEAMGLTPGDLVVLEDEENVRPFGARRVQPTFHGPRAGFQDRHLAAALRLLGVQHPDRGE